MMSNRHDKQLNIFRTSRRIQNAVKNRTNQQELEGIQRSHQRHQYHGTKNLPPIRQRVTDEPRQLAHTTPDMPQPLTGGEIDMRYKGLFYCPAAESPSG